MSINNEELYESMYDNQRKVIRKLFKLQQRKEKGKYEKQYREQRQLIKKMIKMMGKQELVNILQEMKIISSMKIDSHYELLKGINKVK